MRTLIKLTHNELLKFTAVYCAQPKDRDYKPMIGSICNNEFTIYKCNDTRHIISNDRDVSDNRLDFIWGYEYNSIDDLLNDKWNITKTLGENNMRIAHLIEIKQSPKSIITYINGNRVTCKKVPTSSTDREIKYLIFNTLVDRLEALSGVNIRANLIDNGTDALLKYVATQQIISMQAVVTRFTGSLKEFSKAYMVIIND